MSADAKGMYRVQCDFAHAAPELLINFLSQNVRPILILLNQLVPDKNEFVIAGLDSKCVRYESAQLIRVRNAFVSYTSQV